MKSPLHTSQRSDSALPFVKWLDFLMKTTESTQNMQRVSEFFSGVFLDAPEQFPIFMEYIASNLRLLKGEQKMRLAQRYLFLISPLCERMGLFEQKNKLDTICFRITDPVGYDKVEKFLKTYKRTAARLINKVQKIIGALLTENGIKSDIFGRYKHPYSIYRKLKTKGKDPISLFDIFAFRIVLPQASAETCFEVLGILHDRFTPLAGRFKDYITIPKVNGYQSLHTILKDVVPGLDTPIEIQIRTDDMHAFAEYGMASHWLYANEKKSKVLTEKERKLVEHVRSMQQEDRNVYCFTPAFDVIALPQDGTVLHFASVIHSDLVKRAIGSRINGLLHTLETPLFDGDVVEILTA